MTMQPVGARMPNGVRISELVGRLPLNGEGVREKNSVGLYVGACCPARRQFGVVGHLTEPPANRQVMYFVCSEVAKRKPGFAWGENFDRNPPVQQPAPLGAICQPVPRRARGWGGLAGGSSGGGSAQEGHGRGR